MPAHRPRRPRRLPFLAAVPLLLTACDPKKIEATAKPDEPRLVRTAEAQIQDVQREIRTPGFLESEHQAAIVARVGGRIRELNVDEGSRVQKGQALARLDDRQVQSALQQLTVQRDAKSVDKSLAGLEIEAAGKRVQQARLESQRAKAEWDRQSSMDKEFVAPKALQDAELAYQTAEQALQVAEFNEKKSRLEVDRIDNQIKELEAKITESQVQIEDHTVAAPFDGILVKRHVSQGATVQVGATMFDIVDPDHLVSWLDRPQIELEQVRSAREVHFTTDAVPGKEFVADVDLISPTIDRQTGHFRLRFRVRGPDTQVLVHGMFVRARILAEDKRPALMVPKTAVLSEGQVSVVMVVRDGKANRVDLDPGLELKEWIECKNRGENGLRPGDLVIVTGHEDLKDQAAVTVAKE